MRLPGRHAVPLLLASLAGAPVLAQAPGAPSGLGPRLAAAGTVARDTARDRAVLAQVTVPEGFATTLFAGPPVAMYPTVVQPAPDGSVYMGTDLNLAQGAVKGRGRVVRLVDDDDDGRADRYSIFVEADSPRGIAVDGDRVYVLHVPLLVAYQDVNRDGVADRADTLVRDLGFGLDVRASDHSTNNVQMGMDGWLYVAVGDYGFLNARGKDGSTITNRGGAVVRVRPDGTGLEIVTAGTRNIYDVGVDPFGRVFARDNTNDGEGWDTRVHYAPWGAHMGYPSLFRNFADEHMPSIADFGAGAGTGGLWVQDPGFPDEWSNALYTGDWTLNKIFRHRVTPKGASFAIDQTDFVVAPRIVDMAMDDRSRMYVASLVGGMFNYMGDTVGAIVRVSFPGRPASPALRASTLPDARLVAALGSPNYEHRLQAQREILRRGARGPIVRDLEAMILAIGRPIESRVAALYTLGLLGGPRALPALTRAAADPALRASALKVYAESPRLGRVPTAPLVRGLTDADPAVRLQAVTGLVRLRARDQAAAIVPLLADADPAVAHVAARGLAALGAYDVALAALTAGPAAARPHARQALQLIHHPAAVRATIAALGSAPDADVRRELLLALARLANREAPYRGEWWGVKPASVGPYFAPVPWEETAAIRPVLREALLAARGADFERLVADFTRNRVLPLGARALLLATEGDARTRVVDALIAHAAIPGAAAPLLERLDAAGGAQRAAVAELLAGESGFAAELAPLVSRTIADAGLPWAARAQVLTAAGRLDGDQALATATAILARANPTPRAPAAAGAPAPAPANPSAAEAGPAALDAAWRRFVGARERQAQLEHFAALARGSDPAQRVLGYAVLVQSVRNPRWTPEPVLTFSRPIIEAAWRDPAAAASLAQAVRVMRVESQYAEQLRAYDAQTRP